MPSVPMNRVVAALALILAIGGLAGAARAAGGTGRGPRAMTTGATTDAAAAAGSNTPGRADQPADCPRPGEPGTSPFPFFYAAAPIAAVPAIGEDGSLYVATSSGNLYGIDCHGKERWRVPPLAPAVRTLAVPPPVLHTDGRVYMGFGTPTDSMLHIVAAGDGSFQTQPMPQSISSALSIDTEQRLYIGLLSNTQAAGSIIALDRSFKVLPGFAISTHRILASPVGLSGDRVVFASQVNIRAGGPIGGATATTVFPVSRTPDASGTAVASGTPSAPVTPPVSSTPTSTPVAGTTATAANTASPSASARTWHGTIFLPLASTGIIEAGATSARHEPGSGSALQQATATVRQPPPRSTPTLLPGSPLAQLHIITDAKAPGKAFALGEGSATSLVGTGDVVIVTLAEQPPRMVALAVDSDPPVLLWQHFSRGSLPGNPALGILDPETGRLELVYADASGLLVSMSVPGTPWATGRPTFNWARDIDEPAISPPVLGDNGELYVATRRSVLAFSRADGEQRWSFPWGNEDLIGPLALAPGGMLYAGTSLSIVAISTGSHGLDPKARWPAPRHDARNSGMAAP